MTIEIKQLVVRAVVAQRERPVNARSVGADIAQSEELCTQSTSYRQLVDTCVREVLRRVEKRRER